MWARQRILPDQVLSRTFVCVCNFHTEWMLSMDGTKQSSKTFVDAVFWFSRVKNWRLSQINSSVAAMQMLSPLRCSIWMSVTFSSSSPVHKLICEGRNIDLVDKELMGGNINTIWPGRRKKWVWWQRLLQVGCSEFQLPKCNGLCIFWKSFYYIIFR